MSGKRGVGWFLVLAFAGAWLPWFGVHLAGGSLQDPFTQLVSGAFVPAIAECLVRGPIARIGFADSGHRPRIAQAWRIYLVAMTMPWAVLAVVAVIAITDGFSPGPMSGSSWLNLACGPVICLVASPIFWGEEFGWTAYLRDRLVPGRPIATTLATGVIWGVWHWPLPWVGYFGGDATAVEALWGMVGWLPLSILLEFVIGWLWTVSGSVWPGCMLHAGSNLVVAQGMSLLMGDAFGPSVTTLLLCAGLTPFVAVIVLRGHAHNATHRRRAPVRS